MRGDTLKVLFLPIFTGEVTLILWQKVSQLFSWSSLAKVYLNSIKYLDSFTIGGDAVFHAAKVWRMVLKANSLSYFVSQGKNSAQAISAAPTLSSHWKISSSRVFTYLHFAYYEALSGSHSEPVPGNSIKHSVACHSRTGLWVSTSPLFPCHWYAHIQITRPALHSQGHTSIPFFLTASFNDFITHLQDFFFSLGNMPRMVFFAWAHGESCKGSWEYWRSKAPWLSLSLRLDVGWAGRTKSPDQCLSKWDLKPLGC